MCNLPQCVRKKKKEYTSRLHVDKLLQTVHVFTQSFYIRDVLIVHVQYVYSKDMPWTLSLVLIHVVPDDIDLCMWIYKYQELYS